MKSTKFPKSSSRVERAPVRFSPATHRFAAGTCVVERENRRRPLFPDASSIANDRFIRTKPLWPELEQRLLEPERLSPVEADRAGGAVVLPHSI
jgi:hypothetical protein